MEHERSTARPASGRMNEDQRQSRRAGGRELQPKRRGYRRSPRTPTRGRNRGGERGRRRQDRRRTHAGCSFFLSHDCGWVVVAVEELWFSPVWPGDRPTAENGLESSKQVARGAGADAYFFVLVFVGAPLCVALGMRRFVSLLRDGKHSFSSLKVFHGRIQMYVHTGGDYPRLLDPYICGTHSARARGWGGGWGVPIVSCLFFIMSCANDLLRSIR